MDTLRKEDPGRRDLLVGLVLVLIATALYRSIACERFANDGPQLASVFVLVPDSVHWQILYLPLARLVGRLLPFGDPFEPLRLLSAGGVGVGLGASYVLARGFGLGSMRAFAAVAIVGAARYATFFGATIEVHALHFAMVACAACATLYAPWRRPVLALPIAAAALGATWTTHGTAVLLGPGWVALVAFARARVAAPFRMRTLLFVVGPVLLAGLLAVMLPLKSWWVRTTDGQNDLELGIIASYFRNADHVAFLLDGLVKPLGLVLPLAIAGLVLTWRRPAHARAARTLALVLWLPTAFVIAWGVPEDGGYLLGHAPFHVALVAGCLHCIPPHWFPAAAFAFAAQLALSASSLRAFDSRLNPDERVALARDTFGERGHLGKPAFLAPDATIWLPGVVEVPLVKELNDGFQAGVSPEDLADAVAPALAAASASAPVALDVTYRTERFDLVDPGFKPYVDAFVAALCARFRVEERSRAGWTFVVLRPR